MLLFGFWKKSLFEEFRPGIPGRLELPPCELVGCMAAGLYVKPSK